MGNQLALAWKMDPTYLTDLLFMRVGRNFYSSGEIKK